MNVLGISHPISMNQAACLVRDGQIKTIKPLLEITNEYLLVRGGLVENQDRNFEAWAGRQGFEIINTEKGPEKTGSLVVFKHDK